MVKAAGGRGRIRGSGGEGRCTGPALSAAQIRRRLLPRRRLRLARRSPGSLLSVPVLDLAPPRWSRRPGARPPRSSCRSCAGGLLLRPASLLLLYAAAAAALVVESAVLGPYRDAARGRVTPGTVLRGQRGRASPGCSSPSSAAGSACPGGAAAPCSSTCASGSGCRAGCRGCPAGWHAEMALRPAGGQSFSGDFVVATRSPDGRILEAVLTDVSGKGMDAGSRALLLSGAFGGLLGSLPPHALPDRRQRLPAAPELGGGLRHLRAPGARPGDRRLRAAVRRAPAGHAAAAPAPGAGRRRPPRARCSGCYDGAEFDGVKGTLRSGDVLMLFTDGLVEAAGRDSPRASTG